MPEKVRGEEQPDAPGLMRGSPRVSSAMSVHVPIGWDGSWLHSMGGPLLRVSMARRKAPGRIVSP